MTVADSSATRSVLFDLGRVLVDWDPRYLYRSVFEDETAMEAFLSSVCTMEWHRRHDEGVSMADNRAALTKRFPEHAAHILAWDERWADMFAGPIHGTVALVERLHAAGVPLYALTNLPGEKWGHIQETFGFMARFRDVVVSGHEKLAKPDPAIFHLTFARMDAEPQDVVFIDDVSENVAAARALGVDAILFTSPEALAPELEARGLLPAA